jgi:5-(carboxyamino)imidazole ribonucleotide synthase
MTLNLTKSYEKEGRLPLIGIIGGGQLARMQAQAASRLGCQVRTIEKTENCPAASVVHDHQVGDWNDPATLIAWAKGCDLITLENEFVEADSLEKLEEAGFPVIPTSATMATVQDKLTQKQRLKDRGLPVPTFHSVSSKEDILAWGNELGWPLVLKKRKQGYDGKGNATIRDSDSITEAWETLGNGNFPLYVEAFCPFVKELAVMVVRSVSGSHVEYPVVETIQKDHICHVVTAPSSIDSALRTKASDLARQAIEAVDGLGCFGVEMFLTSEEDILINELAPRVHNSGHYTIEACRCSQFENHIRSILGWPLGDTSLVKRAAVMINLLGACDGPSLPGGIKEALQNPDAHLHIYGKSESRKGRKMGHLTLIGENLEETTQTAKRLASNLLFGQV